MALRDELTPLTHDGRVGLVLKKARQKDPSLAELERGEAFDRRMAGIATFVDRDGARVVRELSDPSRTVRSLAMVLAPLVCDDDQAQRALELAWALKGERRLMLGFVRRKRRPVVDRFLQWLHDEGHHRELIDALSFGSEASVRKFLPVALERPSARFWQGLATQQASLFVELLVERWRAHEREADPVTRQLTARFHPVVVEKAPTEALGWCRVLLEHGVRPDDEVWRRLLRKQLDACVKLAIEFDVPLPIDALWKRGHRISLGALADLMRHAPQVFGGVGPWVKELPDDARRALADAWCSVAQKHPKLGAHLLAHATVNDAREAAFVAWSRAARDSQGAIAPALLEPLPIDLAEREARRHVTEVEALQTNPSKRLTGRARFLPWDELSSVLKTYLGHPEGELRAVALREQLSVPGLRPDDSTLPMKALDLVTARKFEQDPIRAAMFETLALWPKKVWKREHLPKVAQAVRDALDASDCSTQTASAAERLVVRLFAVDASFAATQLTTLIRERGALHDANLGAKLSRDEVRAAGPTLLELATEWEKTERWPWLHLLCTGLGDKLTAVDGLVDVVLRARDRVPHEQYAVNGTRLLAMFAPETYETTLRATVERFLSRGWYTGLAQLGQQHGNQFGRQVRRRFTRRGTIPQPLVDGLSDSALKFPKYELATVLQALSARAPTGFSELLPKLLKGDESVVILPVVHDFLHRHRQDLLGNFLGHRVISGRYATGSTRWILPFTNGFFRWSPEQSERFANALDAIVGDEKRDTPTVFSALVTWPEMPWASMERLTARATDKRPAVQEKAIRVLSRCDAGQGVPTLLECLSDSRSRFAIYGLRRAVLRMLPSAAAAVLSKAPLTKVTVAKEVIRLLGELRDDGAYKRVLELVEGKLHRDVRIAVLRALWDHLDREPTWVVYDKAVDDPDWVLASRLGDVPADRLTKKTDARLAVLLAKLVNRPEPEARIAILQRAPSLAVVDRERVFLSACRARLESRLDDEVSGAMSAMLHRCQESDVPALEQALHALKKDRRMLEVAAELLLSARVASRGSWKLMAEAVERVARSSPVLATLRVKAAAARDDREVWAKAVEAVAKEGRLDADVVTAAAGSSAKLQRLELDPLVERFLGNPDAGARRLSLLLLEKVVAAKGWSPERLGQLRRLREDASPWVASAAAMVWPPREDDPGFVA